jgi:hypothetical protein
MESVPETSRTYNCFGVVQSDTPGQAALRQKPEVRDSELVELQTISDICGLGWARPTSFGTSCMPWNRVLKLGVQGIRVSPKVQKN